MPVQGTERMQQFLDVLSARYNECGLTIRTENKALNPKTVKVSHEVSHK